MLTRIDTEFEAALLALDRLAAARLLSGPSDTRRLEDIVIPALQRIGLAWEQGRVALSQVYMSGRICEELLDSLLPEGPPPPRGGGGGNEAAVLRRKDQPKMALAVLEDYHLLGKRMVLATLRASGYELLDYGRVDVESLLRRTCEEGIEVLMISTLMLPSALRVARVREGLDRSGGRVKLVVGGAPFRLDEQLWREVGADAMGKNASDIVGILESFAKQPS